VELNAADLHAMLMQAKAEHLATLVPAPRNTTYSGIHRELRLERGRAAEYTCVDCGGAAQEWSYNGGDPDEARERVYGAWVTYSTDIERYAPRCRLDHRRLDRDRAKARRLASAR
jgi:hypothetical protein